jgi:hypothetical protein
MCVYGSVGTLVLPLDKEDASRDEEKKQNVQMGARLTE